SNRRTADSKPCTAINRQYNTDYLSIGCPSGDPSVERRPLLRTAVSWLMLCLLKVRGDSSFWMKE
ncbi:hypothetical protein HAX54_052885, partial [Datura stramonium]|nr:hypothetical protein [Datura stramonium]